MPHRIKKSILLLSLSSIVAFTGCAEDSDSTVAQIPKEEQQLGPINADQFAYSDFSFKVGTSGNESIEDAVWKRVDTILSTNNISRQTSLVKPSDEIVDESQELPEYYTVAGNGFELKINQNKFDNQWSFTVVDTDTFSLELKDSVPRFIETFNISSFDLTGFGRREANGDINYSAPVPQDENEDNTSFPYSDFAQDNTSTGLITDLRFLTKLSTDIKFPQNSKCYVLQESANLQHYKFNTLSSYTKMDYEKLDDWLNDMTNNLQPSGLLDNSAARYEVANIVRESIGKDNLIEAVRFTDQFGRYHAAVKVDGRTYRAIYNGKDEFNQKSIDPEQSSVYCESYNNIAADFIAKQIISYL